MQKRQSYVVCVYSVCIFLFILPHKSEMIFRYYLVHRDIALNGDRSSSAMVEQADPLCMKIELEVPVVLFGEFDHIVSYMYGNQIHIGESHLIYLYVLVTKLKLNGGLESVLYHKIKKNCDKFHCVPYLLQAEELKALELVWLCSDAILQNLSTISDEEWVNIPYTAFNLLMHRAKGGIDKYSVSIVSDVIVQYLKAKMSKNPTEAKQIVLMIDAEDINTVSTEYALPIIKICDVLFADKAQKWRYEHITLYQLSMHKISFEFTSFHKELCQQLQGLSPITFSDLLIRADHLKENALHQAWEHYKEGNHAAYFNDKRLKIGTFVFLSSFDCMQLSYVQRIFWSNDHNEGQTKN